MDPSFWVMDWFCGLPEWGQERGPLPSIAHFSSFLVLILPSIPFFPRFSGCHRLGRVRDTWALGWSVTLTPTTLTCVDILTILFVVGGSGVSPYELIVWVVIGKNADLLLSLIHPWSPYPHSQIITINGSEWITSQPSVGWCWTCHKRSTFHLWSTCSKLRMLFRANHPWNMASWTEETNLEQIRFVPDTRNISKKPNEPSKAVRRPSPGDSMTGQWELGTTSRTVGPESCRLSTYKPLVISTYNVRTLHQQGKTHQLFMGCSDVGIDIIGIQEHRLITKEPTEELSDDKIRVLVYSSATEQRHWGVGLLMSKHIYKWAFPVPNGSQTVWRFARTEEDWRFIL